MTRFRLTVLGCGASLGTPLVTGSWGKADPNHPKNKRTRSSLAIQLVGSNSDLCENPDTQNKNRSGAADSRSSQENTAQGDALKARAICSKKKHQAAHVQSEGYAQGEEGSHEHPDSVWLIDAGPDVRQQLLRQNMRHVQGVFLTHGHADHMMGLHELSPFFSARKTLIPVYGDAVTLDSLQSVFGFLIDDGKPLAPGRIHRPVFEMQPLVFPKSEAYQQWIQSWRVHTGLGRPAIPEDLFKLHTTFLWQNIKVQTFFQSHGPSHSLGYRFGNWAYSTDVKDLSDEAIDLLQDLDVWFIDCTAPQAKTSHAGFDQVMRWIKRVGAKRTVLIHLGHEWDYDTLKGQLPKGAEPAYDGLQVIV